MKVTKTPIEGLLILEPKIFADQRGQFLEVFQQERYLALGIPPFVQDNLSHSKRNVLRGLHYQLPRSQGKLVWTVRGKIWDIAVDIRVNSPTFGQWHAVTLSDENHRQFYIPPGFAHGFCVLSETADVYYKCTDFYTPHAERGIIWHDRKLNIPWPCQTPILSPKDEVYPELDEIAHAELFT